MWSRHLSVVRVVSPRTPRPPNFFHVDRQQTLFHPIEITFSGWQCQDDPVRIRVISGFRSIQLPSNAPSVPSDSLALTICGPIFARTRTNGLSCARYVLRLLLVSMTGNATKDSTLARRNSSVVGVSNLVGFGGAEGGLRAPMLWAAISVARLVGFVYVLCWRRRRQSDIAIICLRRAK